MNVEAMIRMAEDMSHTSGKPVTLEQSGGGCFRKVYCVDQYAFKLARGVESRTMNRSEWSIYYHMNEAHRELFAKPIYISQDGSVVVMECLTIPPYTMDWTDACRKAERHIMSLYGNTELFGDLHAGNFAKRGDTVVCIDYAWLPPHITSQNKEVPWWEEVAKRLVSV